MMTFVLLHFGLVLRTPPFLLVKLVGLVLAPDVPGGPLTLFVLLRQLLQGVQNVLVLLEDGLVVLLRLQQLLLDSL